MPPWLSGLFGSAGDALKGAGNSVGGFLNNAFGNGGGGTPAPAAGAAKGAGAGMNFPMMGAGLGAMGLGQMFSPKLQTPNFGGMQSVQNLQNFQNSPHPLDPAIQQSIQNSANIQNEQQLRNLRDTYKNARPGTDYTTDSAYQRDLANLNRQMSMNTNDSLANASLQSNQQQLGNMTNLANLDVGGAEQQYAQQAAQKQNFNNTFGNIGSMFLQKGLGMPNYGSLFNMFTGEPRGGSGPPVQSYAERPYSSTQGMSS